MQGLVDSVTKRSKFRCSLLSAGPIPEPPSPCAVLLLNHAAAHLQEWPAPASQATVLTHGQGLAGGLQAMRAKECRPTYFSTATATWSMPAWRSRLQSRRHLLLLPAAVA